MRNLENLTRRSFALLPSAACALGIALLASPLFAGGLSQAKPLNSYGNRDDIRTDDTKPRIATDHQGNWLGMWINWEGQYPWQGKIEFANSVTSGTTWTAPRTSKFQTSHKEADICYAGNGRWVLLWSEPDVKIAISDDLGNNWTETATLVDYPPDELEDGATKLQIVPDGSGGLMAVWEKQITIMNGNRPINYLHVMTAASADFGQTWTEPKEMELAGTRQDAPHPVRIASPAPGRWLMVYSNLIGEDNPGDRNVHYKLAESTNLGATWTALGDLYIDMLWGMTPDIAFNATSGVIATSIPAFVTVTDDNITVSYKRAIFTSDDSGTTFTGPLLLDPSADALPGPIGNPELAADDGGNWILTYGPKPVSVWKSNAPETTWTLSQTLADGYNSNPVAAGSGNGNFVILSQNFSNDTTQFIRDENIRSISSMDAGVSWTAPIFVNDLAKSITEINDTNISLAASNSTIVASWIAKVSYIYPYAPINLNMIMTATSHNGGRTWSEAKLLAGSAGAQTNRVIYTGGYNFEVYWDDKKAVSTDDGQSWTSPQASTGVPPEALIDVVQTDSGEQVRVKAETEYDASTDKYFIQTYTEISTDGGNTWGDKTYIRTQEEPRQVDGASQLSAAPEIRYLGQGRLAVLIKNYSSFSIPELFSHWIITDTYLADSSDNGHTWTPAEPVFSINRSAFSAARVPVSFATTPYSATIAWADGFESDIIYRTKSFGQQTSAKDWSLYK